MINKNTNDIVGKKFGKLTVLNYKGRKGNHYIYTCRCDCSNIVDRDKYELTSGKATQCEKCYKKERLQSQIDEYIGKQFGRLTVVSFSHLEPAKNKPKSHVIVYNCKCSCGNPNIIKVAKPNLSAGTGSCGCLADEHLQDLKELNTKHGMSNSKFYQAYHSMLQRCNNPNNSNYENYGKRGISVCKSWQDPENGYNNFFNDMYEEFNEKMKVHMNDPRNVSLERKDVEGNYCPENCTWETIVNQNNNKTNTKRFKYLGKEYTISELSKNFAPYISRDALEDRLEKLESNIIEDGNIFVKKGYISPIIFNEINK